MSARLAWTIMRGVLVMTTVPLPGLMAVASCNATGDKAPLRRGPFDELFAVDRTLVLEDPVDHPMGDIAFASETHDQGLFISDRLAPTVRRYSARGDLLAEFGAPGDGPFELRRVGSLLEEPDGRVLIVDPRLGRLTRLTPTLERDTTFRPHSVPSGPVVKVGEGFVGVATPGDRSSALRSWNGDWEPQWERQLPSFGPAVQNPYWGSVATTHLAAFSDGFAAALSLVYPIYLYDQRGEVVDSLRTPPASFREVSVVAPGTFVPGSSTRMNAWFSSFDVIASLCVVQDSLLIVTHGELALSRTGIAARHTRLDVYDVRSRVKIAEDVTLPEGARVLTGGAGLYLLVGQPPHPWTVAMATLRR